MVLDAKYSQQVYSFVDRAYQLIELLNSNSVCKIYDSIIIDEAQDLESVKLRALSMSVKSERNGVCILSDKNQRIFRLNTWGKDAGINIVGRTYYLRINYRTTKQINDYARMQFEEFDRTARSDKEYISIMSGADPEKVECESENEENHYIVDSVKKHLADYAPNEICVLAPTYEKLNAIKAILEYEGIKVFMLTGDEISHDPESVNLCTTTGVKGLEFSVVLIADFNKIGFQKQMYDGAAEAKLDYEKLIECEKYVAITRARDNVIITCVGE
jgi:superfamily I DNA/RNA helicase